MHTACLCPLLLHPQESNSRRAAGYALLEVFVLILVMAVQVFTVTKLFERSTRMRGFSVCV